MESTEEPSLIFLEASPFAPNATQDFFQESSRFTPLDTTQEDSQPDQEDLADDEEEEEDDEEPVANQDIHFRPLHDELTFDNLLYSHVVIKCGIQEVHAPVVSTLMLMAVIGMWPATVFTGFGVGLPVFWLAQRCLAR